jgi:HEAT repeats
MESSLNRLIEGFPANPVASGKFMQRLLLDDKQQFFVDALPLLRAAPDTPGFYYVLALLHSQNLVLKNLCDPALFSKGESIALAKRMARVEPLFDMNLAKILLATEAQPGTEAEQEAQSLAGLRLLEIMAETSDRGRSLLLAQLLHHPNARVRSKAALLVGKSTKDVKWVSQQMMEPDGRLRANALEALWGVESEDCRQVFLTALDDPANRVVGNAILGLYLLGVPSAIGLILKMLTHPDDLFRQTGLWLIGEIGDLRFLPVLARLMKESAPALRPHVFRAFANLKQKRSRLAALPLLRIHAFAGKVLAGGWKEIHLVPFSALGPPLTGLEATQLAVWENSALILEYSIRPGAEKEPLSIAFAIPQNTEQRAVESCLRLKRKVDGWMILQYCRSDAAEAGFTQEEATAELRFILDAAALEKSILTRQPRLSSARSLLHAASLLIPAMSRGRGRRHLILLDDGSCESPDASSLQEIVDAAKIAEITVHGISQRETALRDICAYTGGQWLLGTSDDSVAELLSGLYGYLTASYEVRYRSDEVAQDGVPVELRLEVCTDQSFGETTLRA